MLARLGGRFKSRRREQKRNASLPILVTELGITTLAKLEHEAKVLLAMRVRLGGKSAVSNPLPKNALAPMVVTPAGIPRLVSWEQVEKAEGPMLVTPAGITTFVRLRQKENRLLVMAVRLGGSAMVCNPEAKNAPPPSVFKLAGRVTVRRRAQERKAAALMVATLVGMLSDTKLEHEAKAKLPIATNPLPKVILVRPLQLLNVAEPMERTLLGMITRRRLVLPLNALLPRAVTGKPLRVAGMVTTASLPV